MKTYPLTPPPRLPGLYALKHRPTGKLYIGRTIDLQRRYAEWKNAVNTGLGIKSTLLAKMFSDCPADGWEYVVLQEIPGADEQTLADRESKAIDRLGQRAPHLLLNTLAAAVRVSPHPASRTVLTHEGKPITYAQAALALGCSQKQVQKRTARWRAKGVSHLTLDQLKTLTEKYRAPKNPMVTS